MILLELLIGFLKIGFFSFGGGYGAIPLIRETALSYGWMTEEKLAYMIAVSESTPGPIMVNMATYIGSDKAGVTGAAIATAAVVLPAFLIVIILTAALKELIKKDAARCTLEALTACVTGVILATGVYMALINCADILSAISFDGTATVLTLLLGVFYFGSKKIVKNGVSPIVLICVSGIAGAIVFGV